MLATIGFSALSFAPGVHPGGFAVSSSRASMISAASKPELLVYDRTLPCCFNSSALPLEEKKAGRKSPEE